MDLQKRMKKRINDKDMVKYKILSHFKILFKRCLFKVKVIIMYCGICKEVWTLPSGSSVGGGDPDTGTNRISGGWRTMKRNVNNGWGGGGGSLGG